MAVAALFKATFFEAMVAIAFVEAWSCTSNVVMESIPTEIPLMEGEGAAVEFSDGGVKKEDPWAISEGPSWLVVDTPSCNWEIAMAIVGAMTAGMHQWVEGALMGPAVCTEQPSGLQRLYIT